MEQHNLEVRTYFVRQRKALVARADFSSLYVDYYLHFSDLGMKLNKADDGMLKDALAAMTLHCASQPPDQSIAWTLHFEKPLLNLFVAGNNFDRTIVGRAYREQVKSVGAGIFYSDLAKDNDPLRRSAVEINSTSVLEAVETFYERSEQRTGRLFPIGGDDMVLITAQPGCDQDWLKSLTTNDVKALDKGESLALLEKRLYKWACGCSQNRMMEVLEAPMKQSPEELFGSEVSIRIQCPRCGQRHVITREAMEAYMNERDTDELEVLSEDSEG